ncbi:hypothetical protein CEXT_715181 [Caerostris extrusa]|uniref:Uncharacterized protein n=1 Tax=Caerostris extrusa TaxID=172846 RepID=A0AAV4X1M0_CAEEX|nr:hypothetical protein CEXT_715181 [Caerostris extrusa]
MTKRIPSLHLVNIREQEEKRVRSTRACESDPLGKDSPTRGFRVSHGPLICAPRQRLQTSSNSDTFLQVIVVVIITSC